MDGVKKMHHRVTSEDVEDYSSHIPRDVVALDQEEDIVYRKGVLTHSEGVSTVKMMQQVKIEPLSGFLLQFVGLCRRMTVLTWVETLWELNQEGVRRERT